MTSKAFSSQGITVEIGTADAVLVDAAADTFLEIGEVNETQPPSPTSPTIDVTHSKSTVMEFITALADPGQGTLTCNFIPDDPGQLACRAALETPPGGSKLRNFRVTFPTTLQPNRLDCKVLVTGLDVRAPTNEKVTLAISLKASSVYVWSNS